MTKVLNNSILILSCNLITSVQRTITIAGISIPPRTSANIFRLVYISRMYVNTMTTSIAIRLITTGIIILYIL